MHKVLIEGVKILQIVETFFLTASLLPFEWAFLVLLSIQKYERKNIELCIKYERRNSEPFVGLWLRKLKYNINPIIYIVLTKSNPQYDIIHSLRYGLLSVNAIITDSPLSARHECPKIKEENPMSKNLVIEAFTNEQLKTEVPSFNVGDTIRVHNRIKEGNRERIQLFEGTVIAKRNGGISETFTVRRVAYGCGVEKTFPLHSPNVAKVDVVRRGKVRRAKLFYLRDRVGKAAKVKEDI